MSENRMAELIAFPNDRRVAFVRETARLVLLRESASAARFWQMTCRRLHASLQVCGFSQEVIQHEIHRFSLAVHAEMQIIANEGCDTGTPKGAA